MGTGQPCEIEEESGTTDKTKAGQQPDPYPKFTSHKNYDGYDSGKNPLWKGKN